MAEEKILGVDLGTTYSAVAIWSEGKPHIIHNREGSSLTPSVVAVDPEREDIVAGHQALAIAQQDPRLAIYSVMRYLGHRFDDRWVQQELQFGHIPYKVESLRSGEGIEIVVGDLRLTPQQAAAVILRKLKADAETYLGYEVTKAVIAAPPYSGILRHQAIRDAGRMAGLDVIHIIVDSIATCLAAEYDRPDYDRKTVAVYDLGGGTFNISILDVGRGPFRTQATDGDTHLGGDDLDWAIVNWVLSMIGNTQATQLRQDEVAMFKLRLAAERAKIVLSDSDSVQLQVFGPWNSSLAITDLDMHLTRAMLEELAQPLLERTLDICTRVLEVAGLATSDLHEVLLVGGQTRMLAVRAAVHDFFGIEPNVSIDPKAVVAMGAAVYTALLSGELSTLKIWDSAAHTLGLDVGGRMDVVISRGQPIPIQVSRIFTTSQDYQESIEFTVYEGEQLLVADNVELGTVTLGGIEPALAGQSQIEVTFEIDYDGNLQVVAADPSSGNLSKMTFTGAHELGDEEDKTMTQKARWTILVYMAADSDLDGPTTRDLRQILDVGSTPQVNLLVFCDKPGGATRYIASKPGSDAVEEPLGEFNAGSPNNLLDAMRWAAEGWPAERYGLVLWNHGTGWKEDDIYARYREKAERR